MKYRIVGAGIDKYNVIWIKGIFNKRYLRNIYNDDYDKVLGYRWTKDKDFASYFLTLKEAKKALKDRIKKDKEAEYAEIDRKYHAGRVFYEG